MVGEKAVVTDVTLRDGLQAKDVPVLDTGVKVEIGCRLIDAGYRNLEITNVTNEEHPLAPKFLDGEDLLRQLRDHANAKEIEDLRLIALIATDMKFYDMAIAAGYTDVATYISAHPDHHWKNTFSKKKGTGKTIAETLEAMSVVRKAAYESGRGIMEYIISSTGYKAFDDVSLDQLEYIAHELAPDEETPVPHIIAFGDTYGLASDQRMQEIGRTVYSGHKHPPIKEAHIHQADPDKLEHDIEVYVANGMRRFHGSLKDFGGCPVGKGKPNAEDELLLRKLEQLGLDTGIDVDQVARTREYAHKERRYARNPELRPTTVQMPAPQ